MDQQISIQLFDFCGGGQLCESLVAILRASLESDAKLHSDVVSPVWSELESAVSKKLELSKPQLVLLILGAAQVALIRKFIKGIKNSKHSPEIILITEECDANEILDLMTLGASDFIIPPIDVSSTMPRVRRLLEKAKWRIDSTQSLTAKIGMRLPNV